MTNSQSAPGILSGRLPADQYETNFSDLHPPLNEHEALVAADRCYFCHDAPCQDACPTDIDIPLFIRQISTGTAKAAARTILNQNILGGMCARVCPTETLCEQVCVRETAEGKPVKIGQLQRFATDTLMAAGPQPFRRAPATGKSIAIIGAGPAGLSAAHRLAMHGHDVLLYDARAKAGGLNEFGIASYKSVDDFAAREVDWLLGIGGITLKLGETLGRGLGSGLNGGLGSGLDLDNLAATHDAVFLAMGLTGVNALDIPGSTLGGIHDAVDFISDLRQSGDLSALEIGRNIVVIGGGMTAVDAAVQAKMLGAENVTLAYRRGRENMGASQFEQDLATSKGVHILTGATPVAMHGDSTVTKVEFAYTDGSADPYFLPADQVMRAIGQRLGDAQGLQIEGGKIAVTGRGRTSRAGVWAGGDCALGGDDLTVTAVAQGRDAAEDIHATLTKGA